MEQEPLRMDDEILRDWRRRPKLWNYVLISVFAALVALLILIVVYLLTPNCEQPKHECTNHDTCAEDKSCFGGSCVNICSDVVCGHNAVCTVRKHVPRCYCLSDHAGDPFVKCEHQECTTNDDCDVGKACVRHKCTDVCSGHPCGVNATCASRNHKANCICLPGHVGDPLVKCGPKDCLDCRPPKTEARKEFMLHDRGKEQVSWYDAYKRCRDENGRLATVKTKKEIDIVKTKIHKSRSTGELRFWTSGINVAADVDSEKHWYWMSEGVPVSDEEGETHWEENEAKVTGKEFCMNVQYYSDEKIKWSSSGCSKKYNFICERYVE